MPSVYGAAFMSAGRKARCVPIYYRTDENSVSKSHNDFYLH